ncbi:hypothetical protein [Streptomyces prunicolor]|uniref:hypothetical protein n=1 Tax=Streptomyces prunicolor TaxID=67348 RepID=UPI0033D25607
MANEISYPFNADSADGGSQMMNHGQWQVMAKMFGKDRVDYRLTSTSLDATTLPFYATVTSTTTVSIAPGRALVGGFYYQNTATQTVTIAANTGSLARTDLIVLRADLTSAGQVNLKVVQGQPAASPKWPALTKSAGGKWEMPLHLVNVPANSGALSLINVTPFDFPEHVSVPWNAPQAGVMQTPGTFVVDMDNNTNDTQAEYFNGRDGFVATRHLGKARPYTPSLVNTSNNGAELRTGRWRWIAPNSFWFRATVVNDFDEGLMATGSNFRVGITLPQASHKSGIQVVHGYLSNPGNSGNLPNIVAITATTHPGSTTLFLHFPNNNTVAEGLDGLRGFPARSTFSISGVIEANAFNE